MIDWAVYLYIYILFINIQHIFITLLHFISLKFLNHLDRNIAFW